MIDHKALITELRERAEWARAELNQSAAECLDRAADEIGRLRTIVRVNALRSGATDEEIDVVLDTQKAPPVSQRGLP